MYFCARVHNRGRMLGFVACREHLARVASLDARADSQDPPGDKTSLKIAATATTLSAFAQLFTGAGGPGAPTSDDDETGTDVNTTCAEERRSLRIRFWADVADS